MKCFPLHLDEKRAPFFGALSVLFEKELIVAFEIKKAEFVTSAADPAKLKIPCLPEIALVGRSNVGKSSLINALCRNSHLAKVSSTPGKTRLVNYFRINESFYLVDLPGYGYAKVSRDEQTSWGPMIEEYLTNSKSLKALFLLMDIRREPSQDDLQMAYYLQHYAIPCVIVATKADQITRSQRKLSSARLSDSLGMTFRTPTVVFSTKESRCRDDLLEAVRKTLEEGWTVGES
jgi:GTP-binding protein